MGQLQLLKYYKKKVKKKVFWLSSDFRFFVDIQSPLLDSPHEAICETICLYTWIIKQFYDGILTEDLEKNSWIANRMT